MTLPAPECESDRAVSSVICCLASDADRAAEAGIDQGAAVVGKTIQLMGSGEARTGS
jgi:hypothetical protein